MRRLVPLILSVSAALAMGPARAASADYIAGPVGDTNVICRTSPAQVNIGGACFSRGSGSASIKIADAHGMEVGFWYRAKNSNGDTIGDLVFGGCVTASPGKVIALPTGTVRLEILLDGPAFAALDCPDGFTSTNGTITVT